MGDYVQWEENQEYIYIDWSEDVTDIGEIAMRWLEAQEAS
jgi:hypothetical protein